eukprot:CAMPEP_0195038750 /NCGR_PEP_ID=MMETSP0326_2-20130528/78161_1 /TAXON_ID=2866 ORGANISM="Crypthecodinium cohnii, Strain Seligo" /NCGR_SAMPLE_ID=MMETSP0326_2 /ASSEMBLY_ACC=CAM_ASM_000348 /LENGTH=114 /DNA_ID=CAMNT_0040065325 /DNA_START=144 /DNA_END=488 /DNA_ORIENTATION=-
MARLKNRKEVGIEDEVEVPTQIASCSRPRKGSSCRSDASMARRVSSSSWESARASASAASSGAEVVVVVASPGTAKIVAQAPHLNLVTPAAVMLLTPQAPHKTFKVSGVENAKV